MTLAHSPLARCAVEDCRRPGGGTLAVETSDVGPVELALCREHGERIGSGAAFALDGATVVLAADPDAAPVGRPQAVWEPAAAS
jgi:hypothetical protein